MSASNKILQAAAGNAAGESVYVEDVFATFLYQGDGTNPHTITNGVNLADEGGLVWTKARESASIDNVLVDTERGTGWIVSNTSAAAAGTSTAYLSFNTDGYDIDNAFNNWNGSTIGDYVSWTFRKQAGFFDVVTYTGDGTEGQTINHNLGSTPGFIMIKRTDAATDWTCHHRSLGTTKVLTLNSSSAATTETRITNVGSTSFDVSSSSKVGGTGGTYVAYVFAHDDQSFGDGSDEAIIKCGTFSTDSSGDATVDLGFEPQWVLNKVSSAADNWTIADSMRGFSLSNEQRLYANLSNAEAAATTFRPTSTGYTVNGGETSKTYIYVAIRRPMKTPESGSDVFSVYGYTDATLTSGGITASNRTMINGGSNGGSGFPVDTFMHKSRTTGTYGLHVFDRIRGKGKGLLTDESSSAPAGDSATNGGFDFQEGVDVEYNGEIYYYTSAAGNRTHVTYHWKRAPNFFDTVLYTGTGSNTTVAHNLGQAPKFMFIKRHDGTRNWIGYFESLGNTKYLIGNGGAGTGQNPAFTDDGTRFNSTTPTSSVFSVGTNSDTNGTNSKFVAYLWGDVNGVSKVGSYSSDGSNDITVTTGFTPSFVLIKCTSDASTNWIYFDDHRGLGAGKKLYWNDDAAEQSDSDYVITTTATTMTIKRGALEINSTSSGKDYVFLAVA